MKTFNPLGLGGLVENSNNQCITVKYENRDVDFYESFQPFLASLFANYVIETKEDKWLMTLAEELFYLSDNEEASHVVSIAQAILKGDRKTNGVTEVFKDRRAFLYDVFARHLDPNVTFYYEPFLTFRLKEYGELLIDCMEVALDEYLMEQDYQTMIENLRYYVQHTPMQRHLVHIVHDDLFSFYDEHFRKMTPDELDYYLKQELHFQTQQDMSELIISPLVNMLPSEVHVFSNEPDHAVILSIQAIFQERMRIFPLQQSKND